MTEYSAFTFWNLQSVTQLGWALAQGSLIVVVAYLLVLLPRTISPAARVRISLLGLLLMGLVPAALLPISNGWSWGQLFLTTPSASASRADSPAGQVSVGTQEGAARGLTGWEQWSIRASELFVNRIAPTDNQVGLQLESQRPPVQAGVLATAALAVVAICVLFGLCRLLAGYWQIRRLRRWARSIDEPRLRDQLESCRQQMGIKATVELAETRRLGSAAIVGWRKPLLLLPDGWRLWTDGERRAVLAHELAHVKRSDFVSTAIGQLAVAFNFYHPLAHLVMQRLRLDQELAADAMAAQLVGGQQRYVEILAGLALRQPTVRTPGPCQAFLPPRRMFVRRLEMLRNLTTSGPWVSRCYSVSAALVLVAVAGMATGLRPHNLIAQEKGGLDSGAKAITADEAAANKSVARYVPAGLWEAVVCVDVPSVLRSQGTQAILKQADLPKQFDVHGYEISPEDVLEIAVVFLSLSQGEAATDPMLIVRSKQSFTERPQVRLLDSNTIALHKSQEVLALLGMAGGDRELQAQLARNRQSHIRVASKTTWMQMFAKQVGNQGPAMAFAPLWTKVDAFSFGAHLSDNLNLVAQLDTGDPKRVSETLTAAKFLARNYLDSISQVDGELGNNPTQMVMAAAAAQAGNQLLDSFHIETLENRLEVTAQLSDAVYPMIGLAVPAISSARTAARRTQSMNNMKQMLLAFHNYHDAYGHLPPAIVVDKQSGATRSWRVELLPFLEHQALYQQYRKDEPWDSDANQRVLQQMPQVFAVAGSTDTTTTPYQAIVSDDGGLTLSGDREPKFRDFTDGLANTTLIVETSQQVPWTQPIDLSETAGAPQLRTARKTDPGIIIGMADGSVRFLSEAVEPKIWKALTTRSGGESFSLN